MTGRYVLDGVRAVLVTAAGDTPAGSHGRECPNATVAELRAFGEEAIANGDLSVFRIIRDDAGELEGAPGDVYLLQPCLHPHPLQALNPLDIDYEVHHSALDRVDPATRVAAGPTPEGHDYSDRGAAPAAAARIHTHPADFAHLGPLADDEMVGPLAMGWLGHWYHPEAPVDQREPPEPIPFCPIPPRRTQGPRP